MTAITRATPLATGSGVSYICTMTIDEIIAALRTQSAAAALTAGVAHADDLAPVIYAIAARFCDGVYLVPADNELLFNGLHVLAAARHPDLCDQVIAIARQMDDELDQLFPDHATVSLARLLLSVWHRGADSLFTLIEHADMATDAKWALYDVLARLTFDGRVAREQTAAFLARIEQDDLTDGADMAWWGWEQAVVKLGLAELEPALRRVWSKPIYAQHGEADHTDMLDTLRRAAAAPRDAAVFDEEDIRAIDDPVEAVAWVAQRAAAMTAWAAEQEAENGHRDDGDSDAAKTVRLSDDEQGWLAGFLVSRQVPDSTMSIEMLDGFFTALVIGPDMVMPSQYLPVIWGALDGEGPDWDSPGQAEYVFTLLTKHWNAIAARRLANAEHRPIIDNFGMAMPGEEWAEGFVTGIEMQNEAWGPIFDDRRADQIVMPILALCGDTPDAVQEQLTAGMRQTILDQLPAAVQMIAAYWRAPNQGFPRREPARSTKVGRNELCPCGSGKKFKKCCGSGTPQAVH